MATAKDNGVVAVAVVVVVTAAVIVAPEFSCLVTASVHILSQLAVFYRKKQKRCLRKLFRKLKKKINHVIIKDSKVSSYSRKMESD